VKYSVALLHFLLLLKNKGCHVVFHLTEDDTNKMIDIDIIDAVTCLTLYST
jgi:hypothetical protein